MPSCLKPYFYAVLLCEAGPNLVQQGTKSPHILGDCKRICQDDSLKVDNETVMNFQQSKSLAPITQPAIPPQSVTATLIKIPVGILTTLNALYPAICSGKKLKSR